MRKPVACFGAILLACSSSSSPTNSAPPDAGSPDASPVDAGSDAAVVCDDEKATPDAPCGTLSWSKSATTSRKRNHHTTEIVTAGGAAYLYVIGGFDGMSTTLANVDRAPIAADGSIGAFADATPLPAALGGHVSCVVAGQIFLGGGLNASGTTLPIVYTAPIQGDGTIGAWKTGPALAHPRMHAGTITKDATVYVLGGFQTKNVWDDIQRATVQPDGTIAAWEPAGTLPGPRSHFSVTRVADYVYLAGGLDKSAFDNPPTLKDVVRGHIAADGSIGEWTPMPSLPTAIGTHASFLYGGYLYVAGGISDTAQEKVVYRAPLGADHALGAWENAAALPTARGHVHSLPVHEGHVYSVAGAIDFDLNSTDEIDVGAFAPGP